MRKPGAIVLVLAAVALVGCSSTDDDTAQEAETDGFEITGVELGVLTPDSPMTFCGAVALAPARWITDAVFPLQVWIDAFTDVAGTPTEAEEALAQLQAFAGSRMDWQLGREETRPVWDDERIAAATTVADTAIRTCPDLPLVQGLPGTSDTPISWNDLDPEAITEHCATMSGWVEEGIDEFVATFGRQPRHQMEMEVSLPIFIPSDYHGIGTDGTGNAVVVVVPGGACDVD